MYTMDKMYNRTVNMTYRTIAMWKVYMGGYTDDIAFVDCFLIRGRIARKKGRGVQ